MQTVYGIEVPALVVPNAKGGDWCLSSIRVIVSPSANEALAKVCGDARDRRVASREARQLVGNA